MSRMQRRTLASLTDAQREVFDFIVANRPIKPADGHIGGPFDIWLANPKMAKLLVELGGLFRFESSVDRRYIELVILVTGAHWQAQFEWYAHEPMARKAGVPDNVIASVHAGETPHLEDAGDKAAWALAQELHNTHQISDATYAAAVAAFGEQGVAELVSLAGFYSLVSMTLNGFRVGLPEGAELPFPEAS